MDRFAAGFDSGYVRALDEGATRSGRLSVAEWFWAYDLRFDLREMTRGEQEAVRTLFFAQRLELDGFTQRHIELVELVLGHRAVARKAPDAAYFDFDDA